MSIATRPFSKTLARSIILSCLIGMSFVPALAWGDRGHRIVARVAERGLTDHARSSIAQLLSNDAFLAQCQSNGTPTASFADKFACIATWADKVRNDRPETRLWHFVDIPRNEDYYDALRDCKPSPGGDCVIQEIERAFAVLSNPQAQKAARAEALKFIVHFVGDMHQPLHDATDTEDQEAKANGFPTDRGANLKFVTWLGQPTNSFGNWELHAVWDSGILDTASTSEVAFANALMASITNTQRSFAQPSPQGANWAATLPQLLVQWANEAHALALNNAYTNLGKQFPNDIAIDKGKRYQRYHLDDCYLKANQPVVARQLTIAGVRLARILNEALR